MPRRQCTRRSFRRRHRAFKKHSMLRTSSMMLAHPPSSKRRVPRRSMRSHFKASELFETLPCESEDIIGAIETGRIDSCAGFECVGNLGGKVWERGCSIPHLKHHRCVPIISEPPAPRRHGAASTDKRRRLFDRPVCRRGRRRSGIALRAASDFRRERISGNRWSLAIDGQALGAGHVKMFKQLPKRLRRRRSKVD